MLNELPAGHELDRVIARLLGWDTKSFPLHPDNPDDGFINTVWVDPNGEVKGKSVPAYSTDSNTSLSLEPDGFRFVESHLHDDTVIIYVVPRRYANWIEDGEVRMEMSDLDEFAHGAAETVPLARCRAFLAWKALND
jgi:hypothetical protein